MSKKKKKDKAYKYFGSSKKKDDKKKKKSNKGSAPKFKTIKPTLDRKEIKQARKIVLAPVDIPKQFTKVREKCNHADKLITPAEFRAMTPAYSAYTPMLDLACDAYGDDAVFVCKSCYDVLVDRSKIDATDVTNAALVLYLAANKAVSLHRMKDDEVKAIAKLKSALAEWGDVADLIDKVDQEQPAVKQTNQSVDLNSVGNAVYTN